MTKAKLLVVEDEPNLLLGIKEILDMEGYEVITAAHGRQALEIMEDFKPSALPDLILSDIMMPYLNGLDLLQEIRKRREWARIPFIFLTARGEKADVQTGRKLLVNDYLIKPFDAEDLIIAVESRLKLDRISQEATENDITDAKRKILNILNHEFRTPLTLIVAYSELLKDNNVGQMNDEEMLLFLREIDSGAGRLRRLVENFIMLVELQSGDCQKTYEWRRREITDLVDIILAVHHQVIVAPGVTQRCTINVPESLPILVGDREYIAIILRELLMNAIKFSRPDDTIAIDVETRDDKIYIHVKDTGRGIPPNELQRIWDIFYQINREQYEDQGAGSGLTIANGLANLHDGQIEVDSTVGVGSRFTLILPTVPESIR